MPPSYSALIVFYLLCLAWITVIFALPSCLNLPGDTRLVKTVSIFQSAVLFAFAFSLLITARTFGSALECNQNAMVVLFKPFKVFNAGRILGWIGTVVLFTLYTGMTILDYIPQTRKEWVAKVLLKRLKMSPFSKSDGAPSSEGGETAPTEVSPPTNSEPQRQQPQGVQLAPFLHQDSVSQFV